MSTDGQDWKDAELRNEELGAEFTMADVFVAVHHAVDFLAEEQPGGADVRDICAVAETCARAVEMFVDARNALRKSKGLPPIYPRDAGQQVIARACRVCGCSDTDCRGCIEKTGEPCHWVEPDLCSACAGEES